MAKGYDEERKRRMEVTIDVLEILELSSSLGVRELNRIETGIGERGVLK